MKAAAVAGFATLLAAAAQAQPITRPDEQPCTVRVVDAPAAVRAEIERWVRAEPRCERELDVTVTHVRGGLHVVATSVDGRMRERVIPDAQSAAVLVVSWMADDSIDSALDAPPVASPPPAPAPPPRHVPAPSTIDTESPFGPSLRGRGPARLLRQRWLTLGASAGTSVGARVQLDVLTSGAWSVGLAGDLHDAHDHDLEMTRTTQSLGTSTAFVAYTRSFGRIDTRFQLGIGADAERHTDRTGMATTSVDGLLQLGAFARLRLGEEWGVIGGPLLDVPLDGHALGIAAFAGVEHRL